MAEKRHFDWRAENSTTKYPFTERATMVNRDGVGIPDGVFLDAALYPAGGTRNFYLSRLAVSAREATVTIGDAGNPVLAIGTFTPAAPPSELLLTDPSGRPAGVLVSEPQRLVTLAAVRSAVFQPQQTEFCPSVCFPRPVAGVAGFALDDGTIISGEVWLVGGAGVAILNGTSENVTIGPACGELSEEAGVVAVHVVGDPLFRRRLCGNEEFIAPRFVRQIRITDGTTTFECAPNDGGDVRLVVDDSAANRPTLRILVQDGGLRITQLAGGGV